MLDVQFVRSQFPALSDGWAYFDNAGGSQVLKSVAERISEYLLTTSVQTGASYEPSLRASARLAEARAKMALFIGARRPEEIVFGHSTTVLIRFLATAMAGQLSPGDEIVVTDFDHESNIGPWLMLEERGISIKVWNINPDAREPEMEDLGNLMTERTRLVCVTHASNILGTINPVREIADFVHARGAKLCVDGVAYAPHRALDMQSIDADYYVFSLYKVYGPHLAVMYGKYDLLAELDGLYHYFYGKDKVPGKLEPGNPNYELAWGSTAIVDYFEQLGGGSGRESVEAAFGDIARHEAAIGERLLSWLRQRNDVDIVGQRSGDQSVRVPTISFRFRDKPNEQIIEATDRARIGIRHGDFHSRRLSETLRLAPSGVLRVSLVHYNSTEEVDRLVTQLEAIT